MSRTNHFVNPEMKKYNPDDLGQSTLFRYERVEELLKRDRGKIRLNEMFKYASDHVNGPKYSICRHEGPSRTVSSSIFVLEDLDVWKILGNPCKFMAHIDISNNLGHISS